MVIPTIFNDKKNPIQNLKGFWTGFNLKGECYSEKTNLDICHILKK